MGQTPMADGRLSVSEAGVACMARAQRSRPAAPFGWVPNLGVDGPPPVVVCLAVPPQIVNISSDITVNEGSSVTLMCLAFGRPEPTVTWRHLSGKGEGRRGDFGSPPCWMRGAAGGRAPQLLLLGGHSLEGMQGALFGGWFGGCQGSSPGGRGVGRCR